MWGKVIQSGAVSQTRAHTHTDRWPKWRLYGCHPEIGRPLETNHVRHGWATLFILHFCKCLLVEACLNNVILKLGRYWTRRGFPRWVHCWQCFAPRLNMTTTINYRYHQSFSGQKILILFSFSFRQDQLYDIKEIAGSYGAFAALRNDGAVITWGDANYGGASWINHFGCKPATEMLVLMFGDVDKIDLACYHESLTQQTCKMTWEGYPKLKEGSTDPSTSKTWKTCQSLAEDVLILEIF